jgi:hypothetical protein
VLPLFLFAMMGKSPGENKRRDCRGACGDVMICAVAMQLIPRRELAPILCAGTITLW